MEQDIENWLAAALRAASGVPTLLRDIRFVSPERQAEQCFAHLCGSSGYEVFQNDAAWNTHRNFMNEVIGGMRPDIVLRSVRSG